MKNLLPLVAAGLALGVAGCSSGSTFDAEGWEPPGDDYSPIACGELLPEWGTGEEEAPVTCWTFEETSGLQDRFSDMVTSMTDLAGTGPVRGPGCMTTVSCQADWEGAEGFVTLASGVSLIGLQAQIDAGESADPANAGLYELTLWASDSLVMTDDEWDEFYEPLVP